MSASYLFHYQLFQDFGVNLGLGAVVGLFHDSQKVDEANGPVLPLLKIKFVVVCNHLADIICFKIFHSGGYLKPRYFVVFK